MASGLPPVYPRRRRESFPQQPERNSLSASRWKYTVLIEDAKLIFGDAPSSPVSTPKGFPSSTKYLSTWLEEPIDLSAAEKQKQVRFKEKAQVYDVPMDADSILSRRSSIFSC